MSGIQSQLYSQPPLRRFEYEPLLERYHLHLFLL